MNTITYTHTCLCIWLSIYVLCINKYTHIANPLHTYLFFVKSALYSQQHKPDTMVCVWKPITQETREGGKCI